MIPSTDATAAADDELPAGADSVAPKSLTARLLSGGAWSLAGRVGSMGCLFLTNIIAGNGLDAAQFSAFTTALSALAIMSIMVTLGVPWTLVRLVRGKSSTPAAKARALGASLAVTAIGALIFNLVYLVGASFLSEAPKWQILRDERGLVAVWLAVSGLCIVCANYLQAEDDFRTAALVGARNGGLLPNALTLLAVAAMASWGALSLRRITGAQALFYLFALGVALSVVAGKLRIRVGQLWRPVEAPTSITRTSEGGVAWFLRESWPNLITQMIGVALVEGDLFWIACLADENVVAGYSVVRHLRLLVIAPLMVASIALPPFIAELYAKGDLNRLERMLRGTTTILAAPSLAALLVLLAAPRLIIGWTWPEYIDAAPALQIAALGGIVFVLSGNNGLTLMMTGRHRELMFTSVVSLLAYCAISPPLVARYGIAGASAAFAVQTILQNVALTLRVKQVVGVWTIPIFSWLVVRSELTRILERRRPD